MYIKLYKHGLVISLLEMGIICTAVYFHENMRNESYAPMAAALGAILLIRIAFGFLSNNILYKKAKRDIDLLINSNIPQVHFGGAVKATGGINFGLTIVYGFGYSIIVELAVALIKNL